MKRLKSHVNSMLLFNIIVQKMEGERNEAKSHFRCSFSLFLSTLIYCHHEF